MPASARPETVLAQAGGAIDPETGAVVPPVHIATTFVRDPDNSYRRGYGYGRPDNATVRQTEAVLCALEGAAGALLFASGMAAATAFFLALPRPAHVVAPRVLGTPEEFEQMKEHPVIGERLCGDLRALHHVRPIVRHHHERLDGSGYPDGLKGDDVPLLAQIIGIVDVYDAITTNRPYHAAQSHQSACEALRDEVRRGWRNGDLVEAFIRSQSERRT